MMKGAIVTHNNVIDLYHITTADALYSIMSHGLVPQVGARSALLNEDPAVFLFPDEASMNDALGSWLADCYEDDEALVSLKVTLHAEQVVPSTVDWEVRSLHTITPDRIQILGAV